MARLGFGRAGFFAALFVVASCASDGVDFESKALPDRLEHHVTILASDEFEGRGTGTPGFKAAADYVAGVFERAGVEPGAPNYRQPVPLAAIATDSVRGEILLSAGDAEIALTEGEDVGFFPPSDGMGADFNASGAGAVVFVGDGIVAPAIGLNAYEGVDARGKIVMMLSGTPDIEDGAAEVHLGRFDVKRRVAAEQGAVGILYIDARDRSVRALTRLRSRDPRGRISLGAGLDRPMPTAVISHDVAAQIFEASGRDFAEAQEAVGNGEGDSFLTNATAALSTSATSTPIETFNVVGVVPGNDPALAGEAVVVTAHLDHLGTRHGDDHETDKKKRDDIYNGAMDNALGTSVIMEAAVRLAEEGGAGRTIIFAALTGEELGLLGAAHLARNVDELGYTPVANINIDMPVLTYPMSTLIGFGTDYSTLKEPFDKATAMAGVRGVADPVPEMRLFVRSDHYRFVQEGIPAVFLFNGMTGDDRAPFEAFMAAHYHKPSDEVDLPIRWADAATLTDITFNMISEVGNAPEAPQWFEGTPFSPAQP